METEEKKHQIQLEKTTYVQILRGFMSPLSAPAFQQIAAEQIMITLFVLYTDTQNESLSTHRYMGM